MNPYTIKHQKTAILNCRGFESHPVRSLNDRELRTERSKSVTQESLSEAEKAREVQLLIAGLAREKTAWMWGSR